MKMKIFIKIAFILLFVLFFNFQTTKSSGYKIKKIVIDAGHGGKDSGASGLFSKEKDIALRIALELGKIIKKKMPGVSIIYTRQKDEFIPLYQRSQLANKNKTDVFISIHCNAAEANNLAKGVEIFTMGLDKSNKNLAVAKRENASIFMEDKPQKNYIGFDPNAPESHILFSLYQNAYTESSVSLAQHVEKGFKQHTNRTSRGVKQGGLLVLWQTAAPSILVEVGFLTNKEEEIYLNKKNNQVHIANAIFTGLQKFKVEIENYK